MRVLLQNADMPAYQKMPCMLIFPAKWENQQINTHASRILAKLGYANETVYLVTLLSETTVRPTISLWKLRQAMTARMEGSTLTVRKVLRLSCESLSLFEVDGLCPLIARLCCDCNNFIRINDFTMNSTVEATNSSCRWSR